LLVVCVSALSLGAQVVPAPTDDWVALGARLHGGFGSYIALGVHIGLDALETLGVERRGVEVTFIDGVESPCPCAADGVILATGATPGRGNFRVADARTADGLAVVVVRDRKSGRTLRYVVPVALKPQLDQWNKLPAGERLGAVKNAAPATLFSRQEIAP
jgi:formylmethanofuran dehydrogenase subunit E